MFLVEGEVLAFGAILLVLMGAAIFALCAADLPCGEFVEPLLLSDEQRVLLQMVVIEERKRESALNRSKRRAARVAEGESRRGRHSSSE